jgi:hypothetical protein
MLGPSGAGRARRRVFSRNLGQLGATVGVCFAFVAGASDCGFPTYGFGTSGAGGSAGGTGASGASGASGAGGTAGNAGTSGGGSAGVSGTGGDAGAAGAGAPCVYPTPVTAAPHCVDGTANDGETGPDCGGADCVPCSGTEACSKNSDCVSNVCTAAKTCSPVLSMTYMSIVADASTPTPKFSLSIQYLDKTSTPLQGLRIRYYFNHNGVAEPLLAHTQATYDPGGSQRNLRSDELSYQIFRYPPGPADSNGIVTDSFLEITFPSNASLTTNSTLNVTQDIVVPGSSSSGAEFQQALDYSFLNRGSFAVNKSITVYRGDQLVWGVPPPMTLFPDCAFAAGVNLNGSTVTVDGNAIQSSSEASVAYSGAIYQNTATFVPAADSATTTLLRTGFTLASDTATWPVANGKYWAYAWLVSDPSLASGQLMIQDNPTDRFIGVQEGTSPSVGWARIGPYAIDVLGGSVKLAGTGSVDVAGVELFQTSP